MQNTTMKITDVITILFPAVLAVLGVLGKTTAAEWISANKDSFMIILGAVSAAASLIYNAAAAKKQAAKTAEETT